MPVTRLWDADLFFNLLSSIEESVAAGLMQDGRPVNEPSKWRRFVGWQEPPTDCCPEIAVWGGNLRTDPLSTMPGVGRNIKPVQWLYDVNIRVSECFVDVDENGEALPPAQLEDYSKALYRLQHHGFFGFMCRWFNNEIEELTACDAIEIRETYEHGDGGCAGFTFVVTVRIG